MVGEGATVRAVSAHVVACFHALETAMFPYAVLHGAGDIPDSVDSDIDIVVARGSMPALTALLAEFADSRAGALCQVIRHESTARYHVLALPGESGEPAFLKIDASTDFRRDGRVIFTSGELMSAIRRVGEVSAVALEVEFVAYLTKRILKGAIEQGHLEELSRLWGEDAAACRSLCEWLLGAESAQVVAGVFNVGSVPDPVKDLLGLRRAILRGALVRHPLGALAYALGRPARVVRRVVHRTGFQIAVLGPDGVGKSTVLTGLARLLEPTVRRVSCLHLRPGLLPARGSGEIASPIPYGRPVFGPVTSILKLAYLIVDYDLGYLLRLWPRLVGSTLLLCDRYYLDVVADPARYRYGGPRWLPRAASGLVAGPDLYVVLSTSTGEVQARKAEVGPEVTASQDAAYGRLVERTRRIERVDASGTPDAVLNSVAWLVLRNMAKRAVNRP